MLVLEPDEADGREWVELDPFNDGPELELLREPLDEVAAIGVETLFV